MENDIPHLDAKPFFFFIVLLRRLASLFDGPPNLIYFRLVRAIGSPLSQWVFSMTRTETRIMGHAV